MSRLFHAARLLVAWGLTLTVLLYAWGYSLVVGMLVGRPQVPFLGALAGGIPAVMLLTARLPAAWPRPRLHRLVAAGVVGTWVVLNAALFWAASGDLIPKPIAVPLFVSATFWVVWLAWLFYWPLAWWARLTVLALALAVAPVFPLLLKTDGLTGSSQVNFTWRRRPGPASPPPPAAGTETPAPAAAADLGAGGPDDFPQYLGPERLAVVPQVRLEPDWAAHPPRLLWRKPVGAAWGGFAVVGDYAVTQEQRGPDECVVCYRVADGAEVWVHADPVRFDSSMGGPGPRATPTVAGGRVYTVGAKGLLNCLDGSTGRPAWSVDILADNGAGNLEHGICGSPLVLDRLVVVSPTTPGGPSLAAYDRDTGRRVWQGGHDRASYSSPLVTELGGVRQILLFNAAGVAGHDPGKGAVLWTYPWTNSVQQNCAEPVPNAGGPGRVFAGSGYGKGGVLFQVDRSADGSWSARRLWETRDLKTKFSTAVVTGGCVVGLDDGILACVDLATGKRLWREGRYGHGQLLLAGGLLLIQAEDGDVILAEPSRSGPRELGRVAALPGKTWNNPALAGRFLLVRNDREAACYEVPLGQGK
jgi:outer membrane protein assembly factor BamB